jgi:PAS domain-containing protein
MSKKIPFERVVPRFKEVTKEDFERLSAEVIKLRAAIQSTTDGVYTGEKSGMLDTLSDEVDTRAVTTGEAGSSSLPVINIDEVRRIKEALRQGELQFRTFVAASSDLVYRMSADWTKMRVLSGQDLSTTDELPDSNWLERYIPTQEQVRVLAALKRATKHKHMFEMEHQVKHGNGKTEWRLSRAIPILDNKGTIIEWLGTASDVTARKLAEQQLRDFTKQLEKQVDERTAALKESRDQLQSILDTTLMQMSILRAVRNAQNEIIDFDILLVNQELQKETGRNDLIGKRYAQEYPGIREAGLFDMIIEATETGRPQQCEYPYSHEGFNKWYSCMFVKLNDGVVSVNMDISARKLAEQELIRITFFSSSRRR